jgi:hypothetical protein
VVADRQVTGRGLKERKTKKKTNATRSEGERRNIEERTTDSEQLNTIEEEVEVVTVLIEVVKGFLTKLLVIDGRRLGLIRDITYAHPSREGLDRNRQKKEREYVIISQNRKRGDL